MKDEADRIVAVVIPILILVFFGGNPVNDKIAAGISIQTADDIEQCGFSGAALSEDCHEFVFTKGDADVL